MTTTRQLAAILFADIQGFTGIMQTNEENATQFRYRLIDAAKQAITNNKGFIVKIDGDGILCYFNSAVEAVWAGIAIQKSMLQSPVIPLRIGIHLGDVMHDGKDIFGDSVNLASRLESFAIPGSILISEKVNDEIRNQPDLKTTELGLYRLKNVQDPLAIYAIANEGIKIPRRNQLQGKGKQYSKWKETLAQYRVKYWLPVLLLGLVTLTYFKFWPDYQNQELKSIAVLPFDATAMDSTQIFLVDGLSEDLLSYVSQIRGLSVISNATMRRYKNSTLPPDQIAAQLDVTNLLRGSVSIRDNNLRIFTELIDAANGKSLWAQTFSATFNDIFTIQSNIAEKIAEVLKARLTDEDQAIIRRVPTKNTQAYELYLKGRAFYQRYQKPDNDSAIVYFKAAIAEDPAYAQAYAGLADAYAQKPWLFGSEPEWFDSASEAATKAITLDSMLVDAYKAQGTILYYKGQNGAAMVPLQKAISINPNHAPAIGNLGTLYFVSGKLKESMALQKKSAQLNPLASPPLQIIGWIYRLHGRYTEAEDWLSRSIQLSPFIDAYRELAITYMITGRSREARNLIPEIVASDSSNPRVYAIAGLVAQLNNEKVRAKYLFNQSLELNPQWHEDIYATAPISLAQLLREDGENERANVILDESMSLNMGAIASGSTDFDPYLQLAGIAAIRGNNNEAMQWLEKAVALNWKDYGYAGICPWYNNLHSDPRFTGLMAKLKKEMELSGKKLQ